MSDKLKSLVEDAVSSYFQNMNWSEIVEPAVLDCVDVNTTSDSAFVNKIVDGVSDALENNVSGDKIIDDIIDEVKNRVLRYQQTPSVGEQGGMMCSKCYRPNGVWASDAGGSISDQSLMVNGKTIISMDDL